LLRSASGQLSDTIRDIKSFTARQMLEAIQTEPESRRDWMLNIFEFAAKQHKRNSEYLLRPRDNGYGILQKSAQVVF